MTNTNHSSQNNRSVPYLFVYGTLCKSALHSKHDYLYPESDYVCRATVQAQLYLVDYYPAITNSDNNNDQVHGEIYRIHEPDALFERLDHYEACSEDFPEPKEYKRLIRPATLETGETVAAWMYLFNMPLHGFERIHSGNFCEFQKTPLYATKYK